MSILRSSLSTRALLALTAILAFPQTHADVIVMSTAREAPTEAARGSAWEARVILDSAVANLSCFDVKAG